MSLIDSLSETFSPTLGRFYEDALTLIKDLIEKGSEKVLMQKIGKTVGIILGLLSARYILLKLRIRLYNYPPGPIGVPLLGCLPYLAGNPKKFLNSIAVNYGPLVYVPLSQQENIYINDIALVKKLFKQKEFANHFHSYNKFRPIVGFDLLNGNEWKKRRQYCSNVLFLITKTSFVLQHTRDAINDYFASVHAGSSSDGGSISGFDARKLAGYLSFNNVFIAAFGEKVGFNDPFMKDYIAATFNKFESIELVMLMDFSFHFQIPPKLMWGFLSKHRINETMLDNVLINWMSKNGFSIDLNNNQIKYNKDSKTIDNTLIGYLLNELSKGDISANEIMADLSIIFSASIDTLSNAIEYGLVLLAKYPDIQEMVYKELKQELAKNSENSEEEFGFEVISKTNLFRAFVHEALRISCVAGSGVPHQITKDIKIEHDGKHYTLPKNALIHYNTFFMQKKQVWDGIDSSGKSMSILGQDGNSGEELENDEIHLEYWLNTEKNNKFEVNNNFILFGTGLRDCVGQSYAKKVIYAIFSVLLLKYKVVAPNNDPKSIKIKQKWGLVQSIENKIDIALQTRV